MKKKNSGFTASGLSRPEIRPGDIFRDTRRGGRVVIRHVTPGNITYRREAYEYDCVMPRRQFERDFILVENKQQAVVSNYHLPDGAIAGSVEALLEPAERARLIKPLTCHHDDDLHFTGRMVSHYENGVEVSCERLCDDCCFGTLPEFIELLTSCGYQVIQGG